MATYDRLFSIIICIGRDFNYGGIVLLTATGRGMWYNITLFDLKPLIK